ncbi:unnamed protein product [Clonostachys rosea]|uniref:Ankyrin repeat protein n=1 Tax=Bionectria ochroleuca TaxID=29856 RepID=A0ABY6V438_BIOOC|nr:unnamed protein product [Clonostachys rosea]
MTILNEYNAVGHNSFPCEAAEQHEKRLRGVHDEGLNVEILLFISSWNSILFGFFLDVSPFQAPAPNQYPVGSQIATPQRHRTEDPMASFFPIFNPWRTVKIAPKEEERLSPHSRDDQGNTPLHQAAMRGLKAEAMSEIQNGADLNATNKDGNTPLHLAAQARHGKVASLLVKLGARTDISNKDGDTPLHLVAATGHVGIAVRLADKTGVARTNKRGDTPLHIAARTAQDHMYTFLLSRGSRRDVENEDGETPRRLYGF